LPNGETRGFLEDGDEITLTAFAARDGVGRIGFGSCRGVILSSAATP
jgi:fumarylacetoacetase